MVRNISIFTGIILAPYLFAQKTIKQPSTTSGIERIVSHQNKKEPTQQSLVSNVTFTSIGPTIMSGRVVDIDVSIDDPTKFYVAFASGGLWKTENNGQSFDPIFDHEATITIGDIAIDWKHGETIWIGTGENNSSRSSYAGTGIYKSIDTGKTWVNVGLIETHRTGRIVLHPENPDIVWVGALGSLYSPNKERGVYKTTDGGKTWKQTLFIDEHTGVVDLTIDLTNPNILYGAAWYRKRYPWNFEGSGTTSGIYKSTDGGETWTRMTTEESGFPVGEGVGRIGLAIYPKEPQIIYAILDNQSRRAKKEEKTKEVLTNDQLREMAKETFLQLKNDLIKDFLEANHFPKKYSVEKVKSLIQQGEILPRALAEYTEDANSKLFDTPVIGAEVYRSNNGGKNWQKTHTDYLDDIFYSYGYYFGQIRVHPNHADKIYIFGVPILKSENGGQTFSSIDYDNMHGDYHDLWINPNKNGHLICGNDGGLNISYDDGYHWYKANNIPVGQFYTIAIDMDKPYNVYGGLQDNGVWFGPNNYTHSLEWQSEGVYPYKRLAGGDGMAVQIDTRDNTTIYSGWQFGNYFRINSATGEKKRITPQHELGEKPLRFNWLTPIHLSVHNQDVLYFGSNKFHRSLNKGEDMETLSGDLTKGFNTTGNVAYGTLTSIHESPVKFGWIYVGSDDGLVHFSKDGGYNWENISKGLPENFWISRVTASAHKDSKVYVSLNGYRFDNFEPYIYVSENNGTNWKRIGVGLPKEPINVIKEDPVNENILYVGTDNGIYLSLDKGISFYPMLNGIPSAAVHDLAIHPRDKELIVATHGRSIYKANVEHLQQLRDTILAKPIYLFAIENIIYNKNWGNSWSKWRRDPPEKTIEIPFYLKNSSKTTIEVKTEDEIIIATLNDESERGLNYVHYNLTIDTSSIEAYKKWNKEKNKSDIEIKKADNEKYYLVPGKYIVEITTAGNISKKIPLIIKENKN